MKGGLILLIDKEEEESVLSEDSDSYLHLIVNRRVSISGLYFRRCIGIISR